MGATPDENRASDQPVSNEHKAEAKPSSIERIRRLEKLEEERLADKERKEEARRRRIAGEKPSGGRNDLVDRIERITRYPMAILGIAWLALGRHDPYREPQAFFVHCACRHALRAVGRALSRVPRSSGRDP